MKILGIAVVAALGLTSTSSAQSVEEFYSGNTITIITAGGASGPYNILARTIEPFLKKHLPGSPDVIVQAMAGAGGLTAANYLYNIAEQDGSVIGITLPTIALNQAFQIDGVQYDVGGFNYLVSVQQEPIVIGVSPDSKIESLEDATSESVVLGSTGVTSNTYIVPTLMNEFLGTKFDVVTGYQGAGAVELAMERGEIDGMAANWSGIKSSKPQWVEEGFYHVISQSGLEREPDLAAIPTLVELASEENRPVFEFYGLANSLGRVFVAPPNVPDDRVAALRDAMLAVTTDPEFIKLAAERDIDPHAVGYEMLEDLTSRTVNYDPEVVDIVREALEVSQ